MTLVPSLKDPNEPTSGKEYQLKITKSLEIWDLGVSKERQGSMTDAIRYYRQAIRMNPDVEDTYRKKIQHEIKIEKELQNLRLEEMKQQQEQDPQIGVDDKEGSAESQDIEKEPCIIFEMLSNEILMEISERVMDISGESWVNLSLASTHWNRVCFSENSQIFEKLWKKVYPLQSYDYALFRRLSPLETENMNQLQIESYNYDYKEMLRTRPFMKFEGVYISVNNYLRHGSVPEGSSSLLNPIHMITYYRYFRFFPNGVVLRLVSSEEPLNVVKKFVSSLKHVQVCKWSINVENPTLLTIERQSAKYTHIENFEIANQNKYKRHNKLKWVESYFLDQDGEKNIYSLKNEKPFIFSRVRSYSANAHRTDNENGNVGLPSQEDDLF